MDALVIHFRLGIFRGARAGVLESGVVLEGADLEHNFTQDSKYESVTHSVSIEISNLRLLGASNL